MTSTTPSVVDAAVVESPTDAGPRNIGLTAAEKAILQEMRVKPWLVLHATAMFHRRTTFDVELDGTVFLRDEGRSDRIILWRGHIEPARVQKVEEILQKNRFCALANSEKTHHLKGGTMSIEFRGSDCDVLLSYPTWKKNPRANAVYRAVRELMDETCADKCPMPFPVNDPEP